MKLKQKIFIGLSIIGILPMILSVYFTQRNMFEEQYEQRQVLAEAGLKALDQNLRFIMDEVERDVIILSKDELLTDADDSDFTSFLEANPETFEYNFQAYEEQIISLFQSYRDTNPNVNSVYFGTVNGAFVRSHKRAKATQYDPRARIWYQKAIDHPGTIQVTSPYRSMTTDDVNLGTVTTVHDSEGNILGVVGMDVTLYKLSEISTNFKTYNDPYNVMVDQAGIIVSHPSSEYQFSDQSNINLSVSDDGKMNLVDEGGEKIVYHYCSNVTGFDYYQVVPKAIIEEPFYDELKYLGILVLILMLMVYLVSRLISGTMTSRILKINEAIDKASEGDLSVQIEDSLNDEITNISQSFNRMISQIRRNNYTMKYISSSTGIHNRFRFEEVLKKLTNNNHSLIQVNIENFNLLAQIYGYEMTSKLLSLISNRLNNSVGHNQSVAHASTSNFVILNNGVFDKETLRQITLDLYNNLKEPYMVDGYTVFIEYRFGCIVLNEYNLKAHEYLNNLNLVTLNANSNEKGVLNYYDDEFKKKTLDHLKIEKEIVTALDHDEFYLMFQPIIHLESQALVGFESLLRWENDELGFVGPDDFIPVAEKTKAIIPIGMYVLKEALRFASDFNKSSEKPAKVSVNISTVQLLEESFIKDVEKLLRQTDYNPEYLVLEITETAFYTPDKSLIEKLSHLRSLGVKIALDDFGIGYSSINNLVKLPVDYLKIDKQLLWESMTNKKGEAMVRMIIEYAKEIGVEVVVEGIETDTMVDRSRESGGHFGQGYLYGKPKRSETVIKEWKHIKIVDKLAE